MDQPDIDIPQLVARAQAGSEDSLSQLFDTFSNRIYRFFILRTSNKEIAEDLTQTVFLEMIQALPRYKQQTGAKFSTWLFQIARFRLIDHYRKQRPQVALEDAPEPSHEPLSNVDPLSTQQIERSLNQLPERYRTVLHLRFREELTTTEIAQVLKTTPLNVRVIQYRALRALRQLLEAAGFSSSII